MQKRCSKRGLLKFFGPILGFYTKKSPRNSWSPHFRITIWYQKSQNAGTSYNIKFPASNKSETNFSQNVSPFIMLDVIIKKIYLYNFCFLVIIQHNSHWCCHLICWAPKVSQTVSPVTWWEEVRSSEWHKSTQRRPAVRNCLILEFKATFKFSINKVSA